MKKDIYKITNLINGKVYIGQSVNAKRRFRDHRTRTTKSAIASAIAKYGKQNFTYEIIEGQVENYNEREKYWINFYQSNIRGIGYNITPGGEEPPVISGERSYFSKYSDEFVNKIKSDIISGLPYKTIEEKYNVNEEYLVLLNAGKTRHSKDETYPLRKHGNERTDKETINKVIEALENTTYSVLTLEKLLKVSRSTILDVNAGKCYNCPQNINYPIRDKFCRISRNRFINLISDVKNNELKFSEIAKKYNVSKVYLNRINNGKAHKIENEVYPLRSSSQRVY